MPGHDNRLSARAELPCRMAAAPKEAWTYDLGQVPVEWALCVDVDDDGQEEVLFGPGPLVCCDLAGKEKWRAAAGGVVAVADVDGDGATEVVCDGPCILSGKDGKRLWTRTGVGDVGRFRIQVGKLLPEVKGLQIACCSEKYESNAAQVWSFEEGCAKARLVWEREFNRGPVYAHCTAAAGRFDQTAFCVAAAVHGGLVALDARDGKDLFRLYWQPHQGEGIVRNYGALAVQDLDGDGRAEFVILNDLIAVQLGVFAPARGGIGTAGDQNTPLPSPAAPFGDPIAYTEGPILWRRYFGEWYPQGETSLHVPPTAVADVDGDGRAEIVVSVHRRRWELKVYDALTGAEKLSQPDLYVHALADLDGCGAAEVIAARESTRTPREFAELVIGSLRDGAWAERFRRDRCRLECSRTPLWPLGTAGRCFDPRSPVLTPGPAGSAPVLAEDAGGGGRAGALLLVSGKSREPLTAASVPVAADLGLRVLAAGKAGLVARGEDGRMRLLAADGKVQAEWPASRGEVRQPVVADVDGDGLNEVVVCRANRQVVALHGPFDGTTPPKELWRAEGWGFPAPSVLGPAVLVADFAGNGTRQVLTACLTGDGGVGVQLLDGGGRRLWRRAIPNAVDTPLYQTMLRAAVGDFTGDGHLDVYLSVRLAGTGNDASQSFCLDGRDGRILWHNDGSDKRIWHHTLGPTGMPTVADANGDGVELNGKDGSFIHEPLIANGIWTQANQSTQWTAYGTQLPVDLDGDGRLEVLECSCWGQWGAWTMDRKLLWTFDPGREEHAPRHPGIADVDGDGQLELGVIHNGNIFRCYGAATGQLRWELRGLRGCSDVAVADVDGDGRPEFLAGGGALTAIKPIDEKSGKVLWEVPLGAGSYAPVLADVDGDGASEILVCGADGKVRLFR
jgi:hypothetical protein